MYLALASTLWAGIDGISNKMTLRKMMSEGAEAKKVPENLETCLDYLKESKLFQDLFGETLLTAFVGVKNAENKHFKETKPTIEDMVNLEIRR